MTYIEKLMSAVKFDEELLTTGEIETLRDIISWQIQDQLCPSDIAFLKAPALNVCPHLKVNGCSAQCWETEVALHE